MPLEEFCRLRNVHFGVAKRSEIEHDLRRADHAIREGKGASYYGIGSALARIVDVILNDQRAILTVCTSIRETWGGANVTISLPHLVGGAGVLASLPPVLNYAQGRVASRQRSINPCGNRRVGYSRNSHKLIN
jgi:L-lactate dehydrogenase